MTKAEAKAAMALHHRRGISLKAAWAQVKHGVRASPGGTRTTRSAGSSNGSSPKGARIGKIYQAGSTAIAVLAPAIDWGLASRGGGSRGAMISGLANSAGDLKSRVWSVAYAENLAIEAGTAFVDKKMGQAAAISRGSVSAILPEAFLGWRTAEFRSNKRSAFNAWNKFRNGYEPYFDKVDLNPDLEVYRVLKHGGQLARKLRTRSAARGGVIARLLEPVGANILRPLGVTW